MNQKIIVRNIHLGEDKAVWEVAKTLEILERYSAYLSYKRGKVNALVAVDNEKIVGCVVPRVATIAGEKIGSIDWVFVDRNIQGRGIGKALVDAVLLYFQDRGCKTFYALVDRYNSPSWNMFLNKGFMPIEFHRQFRVFGWRIVSSWWVVSFFIAPGHFILRKTDKEDHLAREEVAERWQFLLAWLGFSFVLWVAGTRQNIPYIPWLNSIPFVLGIVGVSIFTHELSHKLVARSLGLKTIFKVWESGLVFSVLFALLGGLYPSYGSTFIKQKDWPYNKKIKEMGLIYSVGPVISLILASCFLGLTYWTSTGWLVVLGIIGFQVNFVLALFNLIPIFPFSIFDGRKIFLWNKIIWSLLVIGLVLLLGVKIFL